MGLNIKNERVHQLAKELAALKGKSMTHVILQALEDELEREAARGDRVKEARLEARERFLAHLERMSELPAGITSDHSDLYDEDGLPA